MTEAKKLLQRYGFNGFSFQHIADLLGIKKASLYDHFNSKEELGLKLIQDYHESFQTWADTVRDFDPAEQLGQFFELFRRFSQKISGLCPLSALIGDYYSLSKQSKKALEQMYDAEFDWIYRLIQDGQKRKIFRKDYSAKELSSMIISLSLGSQLSARVRQSPEQIQKMKEFTLKFVVAERA